MIISLDHPLELLDRLGIAQGYAQDYASRHAPARGQIGKLKSSYAVHGYDTLFYALARAWRPSLYLEFGVLSGYSLLSSSLAIRDNGAGRAIGMDLFEDYQYTKDYKIAVQTRIDELQLGTCCTLTQGSVYDVKPTDMTADVLHIDISNNGEVVRHFFEKWSPHVGRAILFEGGGPSRDQVDWMVKYDKPRMFPVFESLASANPGWSIYQVADYPTFTAMVRNS
jgi:hypothetical protein